MTADFHCFLLKQNEKYASLRFEENHLGVPAGSGQYAIGKQHLVRSSEQVKHEDVFLSFIYPIWNACVQCSR